MELIPLSTTELETLAREDATLRPLFRGVFAADRLPRAGPDGGYIVNTDPHDRPGRHWLGLWVDQTTCQVMDSYGLPLRVYGDPDLHLWLSQFATVVRGDKTLQALDSMACGHYALQFLKAQANGMDLAQFLSLWSDTDFVENDKRVGRLTTLDIRSAEGQCNCSFREAIKQ